MHCKNLVFYKCGDILFSNETRNIRVPNYNLKFDMPTFFDQTLSMDFVLFDNFQNPADSIGFPNRDNFNTF